MREEKIYTIGQVAKMLHLKINTVQGYISKGKMTASARTPEGAYAITLQDLENYTRTRTYTMPTLPEEEEEEEEEEESQSILSREVLIPDPFSDESALLQAIIALSFAFLQAHGMRPHMLGLQAAALDFQLYDFHSVDGDLHILVRGAEIQILAEGYQKRLEGINQELAARLKKAETNLLYLRQKPKKVDLDKYSHPLTIHVEPHQNGFLAWSPEFDMAARGESEEAAMQHFRGALKGYTWFLRTHHEDISPAQKEQFPPLRSLFYEGSEP